MKFASTKELVEGIEWVAKKKGFGKYQVLSYFKISPSTMCRWRAGMTGPSIDTYKRVINKLEQNNFYQTPEASIATPEQKRVAPIVVKTKKKKKKKRTKKRWTKRTDPKNDGVDESAPAT